MLYVAMVVIKECTLQAMYIWVKEKQQLNANKNVMIILDHLHAELL
jgi:hypothetical protein